MCLSLISPFCSARLLGGRHNLEAVRGPSVAQSWYGVKRIRYKKAAASRAPHAIPRGAWKTAWARTDRTRATIYIMSDEWFTEYSTCSSSASAAPSSPPSSERYSPSPRRGSRPGTRWERSRRTLIRATTWPRSELTLARLRRQGGEEGGEGGKEGEKEGRREGEKRKVGEDEMLRRQA